MAVSQFRGGIDCEKCRAALAGFVANVLEQGGVPAESPILRHLEGCPRCSQTAIHLIDLVTASQVMDLQESLLDPSWAPESLTGLLCLWQMHLAACNRLADLRGCAVGLSVIGMIRRQLGDLEEAASVHRMALAVAEEGHDLLSSLISHADLGAIALRNNQPAEGLDHLTRARQYATRLGDWKSEARILLLSGDAWKMERNLEEARGKYAEAVGLLGDSADRSATVTAQSLSEMVEVRIRSLPTEVAARTSCPTPGQLRAYQHGQLQGGEKLLVAQHLRQCAECARDLAAVARKERSSLAKRLRTALEVLEATLISPQLQAVGLRDAVDVERPGPRVYRAGEIEVILHQRPSRAQPRRHDLHGLVHIGGQVPELDDTAAAELYRGDGLVAIAEISPRGEFTFAAVEPADYALCLVWGTHEIRLAAVQVT
jgi:hypothetical protein